MCKCYQWLNLCKDLNLIPQSATHYKKYNYLRVNVCLVCRYLPSISLWCQLATTTNQHLNVKNIYKIYWTYNVRYLPIIFKNRSNTTAYKYQYTYINYSNYCFLKTHNNINRQNEMPTRKHIQMFVGNTHCSYKEEIVTISINWPCNLI